MSDDLFYSTLLIAGVWAIITSLWMLDVLACKYLPYRGRKMEDQPDEHWIKQFLVHFDKNKGKRLRILDMKASYQDRLKSLFADYLVEILTERQVKGDWSASEVNKELDRLGNLLDLPDVISKSQKTLADTIKRRLANKQDYAPVKLPDPAPVSDVVRARVNKDKIKPNPFTHSRKLHQWHTSLRSWLRTRVWRHQRPTSK